MPTSAAPPRSLIFVPRNPYGRSPMEDLDFDTWQTILDGAEAFEEDDAQSFDVIRTRIPA